MTPKEKNIMLSKYRISLLKLLLVAGMPAEGLDIVNQVLSEPEGNKI